MTTRIMRVVERMTFWPDQYTLDPPTTPPPPKDQPKENTNGS